MKCQPRSLIHNVTLTLIRRGLARYVIYDGEIYKVIVRPGKKDRGTRHTPSTGSPAGIGTLPSTVFSLRYYHRK